MHPAIVTSLTAATIYVLVSASRFYLWVDSAISKTHDHETRRINFIQRTSSCVAIGCLTVYFVHNFILQSTGMRVLTTPMRVNGTNCLEQQCLKPLSNENVFAEMWPNQVGRKQVITGPQSYELTFSAAVRSATACSGLCDSLRLVYLLSRLSMRSNISQTVSWLAPLEYRVPRNPLCIGNTIYRGHHAEYDL